MGVTVNKKKSTGNWYVWICCKGQRTSRKIGTDRRTALKAATMYRKKLALGEISPLSETLYDLKHLIQEKMCFRFSVASRKFCTFFYSLSIWSFFCPNPPHRVGDLLGYPAVLSGYKDKLVLNYFVNVGKFHLIISFNSIIILI